MNHKSNLSVNLSRDNKGFDDEGISRNLDDSDIEVKFKRSFEDKERRLNNSDPHSSFFESTQVDVVIEFDYLYYHEHANVLCWLERSRWIIYQENYDIELKQFTCPQLSTMSIKSLKSFKKLVKRGLSLVESNAKDYLDILKTYSDSAAQSGKYTNEEMQDIREALTTNHFRLSGQTSSQGLQVPMIHYNNTKQCFEENDLYSAQMGRKRNPSSITLRESIRKVFSPKNLEHSKIDAEGILVRVGILDNIRETHSVFIRLESPIISNELIDNHGPLRCLFMIFGPKCHEDKLMETGRVFSILMSNRNFREKVYGTDSIDCIIDATKRFLESSLLIHLNRKITTDVLMNCVPDLKNHAKKTATKQYQKYLKKFNSNKGDQLHDDNIDQDNDESLTVVNFPLTIEEKPSKIKQVMKQFIPPFHQVFLDVKGLKTRYLSDYLDAFTAENAPIVFTGIIFLYFVILSPAITFGALFNSLVSPDITITMLLIASGSFQLVYMLFCGQPLEVIGITPTMFVVEQVLASLSISMEIRLEIMRFWIGVYVAIFGLIFLMFNGAVIIQHFRRSVEEVYNTYYSTIFILSALFTMFKALPYTATPLNATAVNATVYYNERIKFGIGGSTLFLALVMLNICLYLVKVNRGVYLSRSVRKILGAFNVPLGIIVIVALALIFFPAYQMPTLNIPDSDKVNYSLWINVPSLSNVVTASAAVHGYAICIGLSMFFMLVVEVSTNSISVVKAERKLQKHTLYSLNYICMLVAFPLVSVFLGWPFHSGAMVRSNAHCIAMAKWSVSNAPGVPRKVIGECEQRISGLIVSILVFLSVYLGSALRYIPMASMYGMFLYMGVMGVSDMILWKRLVSIMKRRKHWREHDYLKGLPTWNIRILVVIQIFFISILVILYILSQFTKNVWTLFLFPLFVGIYAMIRGYILPHWPRLNTYLSKMDKKHVVKLYNGVTSVVINQDLSMKDIGNSKAGNDLELSTASDSESEIY